MKKSNKTIYSVDDRGNEAIFYEKDENGEWKRVATLNREAGPYGSPDSVTTWDGGKGVTVWASDNGYSEEITGAEKIVRLWMKEKKALRAKIFHYFAGEHGLPLLASELEEVVGFLTRADQLLSASKRSNREDYIKKLEKRIHNQRVALRIDWTIISDQAKHRNTPLRSMWWDKVKSLSRENIKLRNSLQQKKPPSLGTNGANKCP